MLANLYRWYDPDGQVTPAELARQIESLLGVVFDS